MPKVEPETELRLNTLGTRFKRMDNHLKVIMPVTSQEMACVRRLAAAILVGFDWISEDLGELGGSKE